MYNDEIGDHGCKPALPYHCRAVGFGKQEKTSSETHEQQSLFRIPCVLDAFLLYIKKDKRTKF